ncbi:MAG: P-II family nitrogen regulator [Alphaproteobacteria bacterium]|nr:P-II family nitrogen regulator [Alphaproteobacteria bacterium]
MKFKLLIVMTQDELTDKAIEVARAHGATGCTVVTSARGEGLKPAQTFLGLTVAGQRDVVLFLVEEHHSREILEAIAKACAFETQPGAGVAFQIDIEDAMGLQEQIATIRQEISEEDL